MNPEAEAFITRQHEALVAAMAKQSERVVVDTKASISTQYPPPSSPGEPPHRRTGQLESGIEATMTDSGSQVSVVISSSRVGDNVPASLEFGHDLHRVGKKAPPRRVPHAVFRALAPLSPGSGVSPKGASLGTVQERPYMRPQMDALAQNGLAEIAGYIREEIGS